MTNALRYTIFGSLFLVACIPFFVSGELFFPYIVGKNLAFRVLVEIALAAWVVLMLLDERYRPKFSWIFASMAAFIAIIALADLFGENVYRSFWSNFERMEGLVTLLHFGAFFLIVAHTLIKETWWNAYLHIMLGLSAIMGFMGLAEILTGEGKRIDVTFGNTTYFAIYCVFHIFIAAYLLVKNIDRKWVRVLYPSIAALLLLCLVFTATRGAVLGFLVGSFVTTVLFALFGSGYGRMRSIAIGGVVFLILCGGIFFTVKDTPLIQDTPLISRLANTSLSEGTVSARFQIWNMAWQGVKEKPILGWGQENFGIVFSKYYLPSMYEQEPWFDHVHNIIGDWFIAGGILGGIAYFLIPLSLLYYLWIYRRKDALFTVAEKCILTGLLVAYFIHNLFVFDNITSYMLYALVLALVHNRVTQGKAPLIKNAIDERTVQSMVLPIVGVVLLVVLYVGNYSAFKVNRAILEGLVLREGEVPADNLASFKKALAYEHTVGQQEVKEQLIQAATQVAKQPNISEETKQEFLRLALEEMLTEIERHPNDARTRLFIGTFLTALGQHDEAKAQLEVAHELSPNKQAIMFQLGENELNQGNAQEALGYFKQAFELDTSYDEARKLYALALLFAGEKEEAKKVMLEGFDTLIVDDNRFISAYNKAQMYPELISVLKLRKAGNPEDPQVWAALANAYFESGNPSEAKEVLELLRVRFPELAPQVEPWIDDINAGRKPGEGAPQA